MEEKIKIILFSDSHLGFDYPVKPRTVRRRRGGDFFNNHNFVMQYAKDINADLILHGGDFFFRTKIPEKIIAIAYDDLLNHAENQIPIVIVPGNHESSRLPCSLLTQHPMINIFEKAGTFSFEIRGANVNVSGFPYHKKNVRDNFALIKNEILKYRPNGDINLLLNHHAVEGCTCGPGNYTFRHNEDVIQMNDIGQEFDALLCGHIHRRQVLKKKCDSDKIIPVIYPGSIERTSFAEMEETKGFYVMEWDINPARLASLNFHPLPARPMIVFPELEGSVEEIRNAFIEFISNADPDAIIRIKLSGDDIYRAFSSGFRKENTPDTINIEFSGFGR